MISFESNTFEAVYGFLANQVAHADRVDQKRWQGIDVSKDPSAACYELKNVAFEVSLSAGGALSIDDWREDIKPNLPWADDHFLERVGGEPLNPGSQWKNWPWAGSARKFANVDGFKFNHTYAERLWPRWARMTPGGKFTSENPKPDTAGHSGINYRYGDLRDLVELLVDDPSTRQAYIPLFFPEDTGISDGGRKPCTLGYQFTLRDGRLNIWYPMRSCDFARHFRDDCYLAVRLLLWVIDQCRIADPTDWGEVIPGSYSMWITSLHIFENDRRQIMNRVCQH
jgi:hypothetical protein